MSLDDYCMSNEEKDWVDRYIGCGGSKKEGLEIRRKMVATKQRDIIESKAQTPSPTTPTVKNAKKPTSKALKLIQGGQKDIIDLVSEIERNPAGTNNNHLGLVATAMIYASLPHSDVKGGHFERSTHNIEISLLNSPKIGLPYGKIPRIITAFLCTEAKRTKNPTINLGRSLNEFAEKLGLHENGGKRGDITRLKDQAYRLFTSRITMSHSSDSNRLRWKNVDITDEGELLWDPCETDSTYRFKSTITLSDSFFKECISHSVPVDLRVLHALRSPLAIDIYMWLTYRYNIISKPTAISWKQLKMQFGSNYADNEEGLRNFSKNFKKQLASVSSIYTGAKFNIDSKKLLLMPSSPHVKALLTPKSVSNPSSQAG